MKKSSFSIDSLSTKSIEADIKRREQMAQYTKRSPRYLTSPSSDFERFSPKKLLDWRRLERRAEELRAVYYAWSSAFWDTLRKLSAAAKKECGTDNVWIIDPQRPARTVTYDGHGMSWKSTSDLISESLPKSDRTKAFVVTGEDASTMVRYLEREGAWRRRYFSYFRAFQCAIEERLREFVYAKLKRAERYGTYFEPAVFVFSNDGRCYSVASDNKSVITWNDGALYVDE